MKNHFTSFFGRMLQPDETLRVDRTSSACHFFLTECRNDVTRTDNGDLIVRYERKEAESVSSVHIIGMNDDLYSYFADEYRQNSPVRDSFGNIIVSEDLIGRRFR